MNEQVRQQALKILDRQDVSRKMLFDKLTDKGASEEDAEEVCERFCELGLVDDERYAELVVRHYSRKGYGERRICEELFHRGIDRDLWEGALAELPSSDDTVYRLLCSRLRGSRDANDLRRAQDYLLRRGYSREEVRGAYEHYLTESEESL